MLRYVILFLVFAAVAPLVPFVMDARLASVRSAPPAEMRAAIADDDDGARSHRIERNSRGHYVAEAELNGRSVAMLVDTGATLTALPETVAEDVGIFLREDDYSLPISTANGTVLAARTVIDEVRIGAISLRGIEALVLKDDSLSEPLLGMSVLNTLQRFDMSGGTLVLVQ